MADTPQERSRILGKKLPSDLGAAAPALSRQGQAGVGDDDPEAARLHAILEVAFLTAAADGELGDEEIEHLVANLEAWLGAELEAGFLVKLFEHLGEQLAADGAAIRLAAAAYRLDDEARRVAYKLACVTALCDLDVRDEELAFLGKVADAFAIPSDEAQATFDELDEAVTGLAES